MYSEEEYYHKADTLIGISCQAVHGVFRDVWKRRTGSEWTAGSASDLITGDGKVFYSNCNGPQKRLLEKGKVEDWDLTLLFDIFLHVRGFTAQGNGTWKSAMDNLREERNRLAHNARKKIKAAVYQRVETSVRESLSKLGVNKEKVDKWISDAEVASSNRALEQVRKIEELGDTEYSKRNYQGAKVHYDDALSVLSLPPVSLCTLYGKRASCYLEMGMRESNDRKQTGFYDKAMKDIGEALRNDDSSWNAYFIQAKIYKAKNELKKAIEHLEKALAICPAEASLKAELTDWKFMQSDMANQAHLHPALQPRTLEEVHADYSKTTGAKNCTPEEFLRKQMEECEESNPGHGDVFAGYACAYGWKVEKDYRKAARHYEKAMAKGNALGITHLAYLYLDGNGVPRDIPYAIELLKKAASMPEKGVIKQRDTKRGVSSARHALGLHYHEGIGVGQDYKKAVELYTKAVQWGCGYAAGNLAQMYITGEGMPQDWKMAEMYLKLAVEQGSTASAGTLCVLYLEQGEPDLASFWLEKATQHGYGEIYFHIDTIHEIINKIASGRKDLEIPVKEFESKYGLSTHGLTFMQREKRLRVTRVYQMAKEAAKEKGSETAEAEAEMTAKTYAKYCNPVLLGLHPEKCSEFQQTGNVRLGADSLDVNSNGAQKGSSVTAQRVMTVSGYIDHFHQLWSETGPALSEDKATALIDLVYQITCVEPHLFYFTSDEMEEKFKSFIRSQFESHGSQKGDLDMKLRICYAMYANDMGKHFGIAVLKEGIRRYPNEAVYYDQLSRLYGRIHEYKAGLEVVNQGLDRFPQNVELLYFKAVHTHHVILQEADKRYENIVHQMGNLRRAFKDFIKLAPEDHRKLPEAYYFLSESYLDERDVLKKTPNSEVMDDQEKHCASAEDKVLKFYEKGRRAEENQLPCYLPYESRTKSLITRWVWDIMRRKDPRKTGEKSWTWDGTLPQFIITNYKDYMKDPTRIELVKQHRSTLRDLQPTTSSGVRVIMMRVEPKFEQKLPKSLAGLQNITLQEMDRYQENFYQGKILSLTLIEDPIMCCPTIQTVATDENWDTIRVAFFNVNEEMRGKLGFGCKLSVLNPYMRVCLDKVPEIRVDNPDCIYYLDKVESMCRYCGRENAKYSCGKCGWAKYCDRECQVADWKELKHKYICKAQVNESQSHIILPAIQF